MTQPMVFPTTVEFRIELRVLIATTKNFNHWVFGDSGKFLHHAGRPVIGIPESFHYTPPKLLNSQGKSTHEERCKGWVLSKLAHSFHCNGLSTNWTLAAGITLKSEEYMESEALMEPVEKSAADSGDRWLISYDENISEIQDTEFSWVGVSITSPIYKPRSQTGCPLFSGFPKVVRILTREFIAITNSETHLGVLVRPVEGTLELEELQAITSLLWVADPLLATIHPAHCGPGSLGAVGLQFTNIAENYGRIDVRAQLASADTVPDPWDNRLSPDRQRLSLLSYPGELSAPKFRNGLNRIKSTKSLPELINLLDLALVTHDGEHRRPRPAYDFQKLKEHASGAMIKFNQHCGTLDLDAIRHWTAVCTFLVTAGIGRSSECFHDDLVFLRHQIQQGTISLSEFLHDYDLPATANFYQNSPATKIPDLGLWPTLKKGIPGHESEPILKMGTLPLSSSDRGVNKQFLKTLGNQLDKWGNSAEPTFNGRYTFGIELEVKTPSLHTEETSEESLGFCGTKNGLAKQDPDPSDIRHCSHESTFDTRCERFIQVVKKKLGIFFFKPGFGDQYWGMEPWAARKKMFAEKGGIFCTPGFADDWHAWGIVEDASLGSYKNWKGYNSLHGLELVSPILRDKAECWESMLDVVSGLRRTMRLVVDQKCGVHVNVGKGAELMPFHFYRKLSCLMYCADHVIFSLCRPDRRKEDGFSHPLRDSNGVGLVVFFYARWENIPFPKGLSDYIPVDKLSSVDVAILKKIWSAPDKKALEDLLMRWGGRSCLSILRIQNTNVPGYLSGAVEFRHLEGNLDPELIIRFSQLMVALFQFADQAEPEEWCLLVENLMCCQSPRSYDSVVLWRLLVQLGLGKDFGYWVKRAWKNWTLPSASAMKEWVDDDLHGYMNSLKVEQPVPQKHVEFIRQNICRREGRPQYMSQAPKNQTPRTPEAVDVRREIKARAESILKTVSPGEGISRLNPGHAFSKIMKLARPAQGDPSEEEKPTRHSPEAGQDVRTIHLHQILIDSQHQAQSLQDLELSEQELNKFAGLHCREKNGRGLLDAFPRLVGPMLEINATEEDWGTFLGGQ